MFENPRRGRQARNFTANAPKILDLKSSSEQIFSENWRWVPCLVKGVDQNAFHSILWLSPPQRLPLGIPIKIAIIEKNGNRAGDDGKKEKTGVSLLSLPFPSCPALSLFYSPQPTHNTKRPLRKREREILWQERILFCLRLSTKGKFSCNGTQLWLWTTHPQNLGKGLLLKFLQDKTESL